VRISTNRSNPYPGPLAYKQHPMKVFGTYLCTNNPVPILNPSPPAPGTSLPGSLGEVLPSLPAPVATLLPPALADLVQTFALSNGVAPPCVEQAPNGRLVGQTGKYAQVKVAPEK
jgi:hypothetical protein